MKRVKLFSKLVFVFFLAISISSCSGDDGEVGPAGTDGINGQDGQDGQDGNANVFSSDWYVLDWPDVANTSEYINHAAPEITAEDINSSAVLIYVKVFDRIFLSTAVINATAMLGSSAEVGNVIIYFESEDPITMPDMEARYVIIPSTNTSSRLANPLDYEDYYAVCEFYGINPE